MQLKCSIMQHVDRSSLQFDIVSEEAAVFLRQKTGAQRLEIASRMYGTPHRMLIHHLQSIHPDWDGKLNEKRHGDCRMEQIDVLRSYRPLGRHSKSPGHLG
jgi:hypothetical protein